MSQKSLNSLMVCHLNKEDPTLLNIDNMINDFINNDFRI